MDRSDFTLGGTFWCVERQWRCTDIGTRTIIAIRIDSVEVESTEPASRRTLDPSTAAAEGRFNGPPYAVAEFVFDEDDQEACSLEPDQPDIGSSDGAPA
jgi:hypothetical protein